MLVHSEVLHALLKDPFIQKLIDAEPVFWANSGKKEGPIPRADEWATEIAEAEKECGGLHLTLPRCFLRRKALKESSSLRFLRCKI